MTICSLLKKIRCYIKQISWTTTETLATQNLVELSEKLADLGVLDQGETYSERSI